MGGSLSSEFAPFSPGAGWQGPVGDGPVGGLSVWKEPDGFILSGKHFVLVEATDGEPGQYIKLHKNGQDRSKLLGVLHRVAFFRSDQYGQVPEPLGPAQLSALLKVLLDSPAAPPAVAALLAKVPIPARTKMDLAAVDPDTGQNILHAYAATGGSVPPWLFGRLPQSLISALDAKARTPAAVAVETETISALSGLAGAYPDQIAAEGRSGLAHRAAAVDGPRGVAALRLLGASVADAQDTEGRLPLHVAATAEAARWLLEVHPDGLFHADHNGQLPLHAAADRGSVTVIGLLGRRGALKVRDRRGDTALHTAARRGSHAVIAALVGLDTAPAILWAENDVGDTPLALAMELTDEVKRYAAGFYIVSAQLDHIQAMAAQPSAPPGTPRDEAAASLSQSTLARKFAAAENRARVLEEENARLKDRLAGYECIICMDALASVAFLPCSHVVSCSTCAPRIADCPLCRANIDQRVHLKGQVGG